MLVEENKDFRCVCGGIFCACIRFQYVYPLCTCIVRQFPMHHTHGTKRRFQFVQDMHRRFTTYLNYNYYKLPIFFSLHYPTKVCLALISLLGLSVLVGQANPTSSTIELLPALCTATPLGTSHVRP